MFQRKKIYLFSLLYQISIAIQLNFTINTQLNQNNIENSTLNNFDGIRDSLGNPLEIFSIGNSTLTSNDPLILSNNFSLIGDRSNNTLIFSNGFIFSIQNESQAIFANIAITQQSTHFYHHF